MSHGIMFDLKDAIAHAEEITPGYISRLEEISEKILSIKADINPWAKDELDRLMAERQRIVDEYASHTRMLQQAENRKDLTPEEEKIVRRFDKLESRVDERNLQAIGFIREKRAQLPVSKPVDQASLSPGEMIVAPGGLKTTLAATPSFVVADTTSKVSEAAGAVIGTLGAAMPFDKIGANAKDFVSIQSAEVLGKLPINIPALSDLSNLKVVSSDAANEVAATASQVNAATGQGNGKSMHRVRLDEVGAQAMTNAYVIFDVLPEIVEQHTVEYEALAPPQFPGTFQKYKGNSATQWTLNATFVSRTIGEASKNYANLQKLRGWTKPFFGQRTADAFAGKLGAPPPVLMLSGLRNLIGPVPVVIVSLNWNWPKDVDYIETNHAGPDGKPIPFPVVLNVPIQLVESYSINQFNQFSLADYREGNMIGAFNGTSTATTPVSRVTVSASDSINRVSTVSGAGQQAANSVKKLLGGGS